MRGAWWWALGCVVLGCVSERSIGDVVQVDQFAQVPTDLVDILFVIDDSASMEEEQFALTQGFRSFVAQLEAVNNDFHIGVVSTTQDTQDASAGLLLGDPPFLTRRDDYVEGFRRRARLGVEGSDKEKGLQAAVHALAPHMQIRENLGFLRPDADLVIVFVSDEDDCTDYGVLDGRPPIDCYAARDELVPVDRLVARLQSYKMPPAELRISSVIGPFDRSCGDTPQPGFRYAEASLRTGGTLYRICEQDWADLLSDLGLNALGILDRFRLSRPAVADTIEVYVDDVLVPEDPDDGWTYDRVNWIVYFHGASVPARGAQVVIRYSVASRAGAEPPPLDTGA